MASLIELSDISGSADADLQSRVRGALINAAQTILANGLSTAAQKTWANTVLDNPGTYLARGVNAVIGYLSTSTAANIQAATDSQVQAAVNAGVPTFITLTL